MLLPNCSLTRIAFSHYRVCARFYFKDAKVNRNVRLLSSASLVLRGGCLWTCFAATKLADIRRRPGLTVIATSQKR